MYIPAKLGLDVEDSNPKLDALAPWKLHVCRISKSQPALAMGAAL